MIKVYLVTFLSLGSGIDQPQESLANNLKKLSNYSVESNKKQHLIQLSTIRWSCSLCDFLTTYAIYKASEELFLIKQNKQERLVDLQTAVYNPQVKILTPKLKT